MFNDYVPKDRLQRFSSRPEKAESHFIVKENKNSRPPKKHLTILIPLLLLLTILGWWWQSRSESATITTNHALRPEKIIPPNAASISSIFKHFPKADTLNVNGSLRSLNYQYSESIQNNATTYLERYHPFLGIYLISDLHSNRLLAAVARDSTGLIPFWPLAGQARFPAASLAKIITSTAALENAYIPDQTLPMIGSYYTLYRRQLIDRQTGTTVPLKTAFAKSINPAFGILGGRLEIDKLLQAANLLGWNKPHPPLMLQSSIYPKCDSPYHLAELSCGFTRTISLSALHALTIARSIGSDGTWQQPIIGKDIESIGDNGVHREGAYTTVDESWVSSLLGSSESSTPLFNSSVHQGLRELFQETVSSGTAAKHFRRHVGKNLLSEIEVGGKTGSLDGENPVGRCDWFIGYARLKNSPQEGIAVTILQVHKGSMNIRSPEVAALFVRDWVRAKTRKIS